jgi:uncharacterized protein
LERAEEELQLLVGAYNGHTFGSTTDEPTIATCWDVNRLDLPRLGITVNPDLLCTEAAKDTEIIRWAELNAQWWFHKL